MRTQWSLSVKHINFAPFFIRDKTNRDLKEKKEKSWHGTSHKISGVIQPGIMSMHSLTYSWIGLGDEKKNALTYTLWPMCNFYA